MLTENSIEEANNESEMSDPEPQSKDFTEGTKRGTTIEFKTKTQDERTIENQWNNPPTPDEKREYVI